MADLTPEEKARIYEEEKARIEAREKILKEKKGIGFVGIFFIVVLVVLVLAGIGTLRGGDSSAPKLDTKIIDYSVIKEYKNTSSAITMAILVSPKATNLEILNLAKALRAGYKSRTFIIIDIFDSKEAVLRRFDETYPEKEYSKHWLGQISKNETTGHNEIFALDRKTGKFTKY